MLLHDPQVLLLDEPLSGLDPRARIEMRNLLRKLGQMGKTIIVSSHILPELADICNKVGIINRGEMGFNDSIQELIKTVRPQTILQVLVSPADRAEEAASFIKSQPLVESVEETRKPYWVARSNAVRRSGMTIAHWPLRRFCRFSTQTLLGEERILSRRLWH